MPWRGRSPKNGGWETSGSVLLNQAYPTADSIYKASHSHEAPLSAQSFHQQHPTSSGLVSSSKGFVHRDCSGNQHRNVGLHLAAAMGSPELVSFALQNGQQIDCIVNGILPIHAAASGGDEATVRLLLQCGADANAKRQRTRSNESMKKDGSGAEGSTAMHFAAANGHLAVVILLLEYGASPCVFDHDGVTPELLAVAHAHTSIATLLRSLMPSSEGNSFEEHRPFALAQRSHPLNRVASSDQITPSSCSKSSTTPSPSLRHKLSHDQLSSVATGVRATIRNSKKQALSKFASNPSLRAAFANTSNDFIDANKDQGHPNTGSVAESSALMKTLSSPTSRASKQRPSLPTFFDRHVRHGSESSVSLSSSSSTTKPIASPAFTKVQALRMQSSRTLRSIRSIGKLNRTVTTGDEIGEVCTCTSTDFPPNGGTAEANMTTATLTDVGSETNFVASTIERSAANDKTARVRPDFDQELPVDVHAQMQRFQLSVETHEVRREHDEMESNWNAQRSRWKARLVDDSTYLHSRQGNIQSVTYWPDGKHDRPRRSATGDDMEKKFNSPSRASHDSAAATSSMINAWNENELSARKKRSGSLVSASSSSASSLRSSNTSALGSRLAGAVLGRSSDQELRSVAEDASPLPISTFLPAHSERLSSERRERRAHLDDTSLSNLQSFVDIQQSSPNAPLEVLWSQVARSTVKRSAYEAAASNVIAQSFISPSSSPTFGKLRRENSSRSKGRASTASCTSGPTTLNAKSEVSSSGGEPFFALPQSEPSAHYIFMPSPNVASFEREYCQRTHLGEETFTAGHDENPMFSSTPGGEDQGQYSADGNLGGERGKGLMDRRAPEQSVICAQQRTRTTSSIRIAGLHAGSPCGSIGFELSSHSHMLPSNNDGAIGEEKTQSSVPRTRSLMNLLSRTTNWPRSSKTALGPQAIESNAIYAIPFSSTDVKSQTKVSAKMKRKGVKDLLNSFKAGVGAN